MRLHPVAGFGQLAQRLESVTYADTRSRGLAHWVMLVSGCAAVGLAAERAGRGRPGTVAVTAAATWLVLGGRSLEREACAVQTLLEADDLPGARHRIRSLVGRDPSRLDSGELARAVIESVAENTSDAVVAPLVWGALAGVPGLLSYRAVNTLDAMIGHRTARYRRFGWASARLDDAANWLPARLAAALAVAGAPVVGGDPRVAGRVVRRDAARHPSPNAGQVEAAFAGALGVRLGGTNTYAGQVESRGILGDGDQVTPRDIARSVRLARIVGLGALLSAMGLTGLLGRSCRLPGHAPRR